MTKFVFETFEHDYPIWAKHHEMVGMLVKRVYEDGRENVTESEEILALMEKYPNALRQKSVQLLVKGESQKAMDYYLPLTNQEYQTPVTEFQSGAMNTKQTMTIRYKFLLDDALFAFEQVVNASNNYPLLNLLDESTMKESLIEVAENSDVQTDGIGIVEDDEESLSIVVVDGFGDSRIIEIEIHELLDHLVAVEIIGYEMEIVK